MSERNWLSSEVLMALSFPLTYASSSVYKCSATYQRIKESISRRLLFSFVKVSYAA